MDEKSPKTLYLIPLPISEADINWSIPLLVIEQINKIQCFIVENAKTSRQFIKRLNPTVNWEKILILELDKFNPYQQEKELQNLMKEHSVLGLMSEAGLPCIADPGNHVVRMAHELGVKVSPLSGPSSLILALISSGLNGQNFKFNGYLPNKPADRKRSISTLEKQCRETTQLFIEAPYRNDVMLTDLISTLNNETRILVASDIGGSNEMIICRKTSWWKENPMNIGKIPCMFAIGA